MRISELGGIISEIGGVFRVNGSLAVTRAFGDSKYVARRKPEGRARAGRRKGKKGIGRDKAKTRLGGVWQRWGWVVAVPFARSPPVLQSHGPDVRLTARRHKKYVTAEPDIIQFRLDGSQDYLVRGRRRRAQPMHARETWR